MEAGPLQARPRERKEGMFRKEVRARPQGRSCRPCSWRSPFRCGARSDGPTTADGYGCSHQRVKLAPELKLEKSVEVVHLYEKRLPQLEYPSPPTICLSEPILGSQQPPPTQLRDAATR